MKHLRRFAEGAIDGLAIATFTGVFLCILVQVVLRYVFSSPLTWSEELARYLFIWCAFLGWIIATRRGSHLAMTFVSVKLPPRGQSALAVAIQVATLFFAWVLGSRGWRLAMNAWDVENVAVPFSMGVVYLIVPVAGAAITAYAAIALADALRALVRGAPGTPAA